MENMKQLVGPLEQGRPRTGSPNAGHFIQYMGVREIPKTKSSQNNDRHSNSIDHFYSINYDGGRKI